MNFIDEEIENYAVEHTEDEGSLLARLQKETYEKLEIPQMVTGRIEGQFLRFLALSIQAKRILEVGTFSGYGTLSMASALPDDGEIFTCDEDPEAIAFAKRFFSESPHGSKVRLLEGLALESIKTLSGPLDMSFIDADKVNYTNYYEAIMPLTRPGGLIIVDNVLWSGSVLNPIEESSKAIHAFNEHVKSDIRVDKVMLTIRDGVYCLRKR
jgi:caffeoyl-CoA O-methyltransferase